MINLIGQLSGTDFLIYLVAYTIAILLAMALHEFAHAFVAHKLGDLTPKSQGRLTLNPLKHFDIFGFLMLMLVGFGWAKPVEVNPLRFRKYRLGMFLVSIAGVIVNIILAILTIPLYLLVTKYFTSMPELLATFLGVFLLSFIIINATLFVFNLIPIHPLDGFKVLDSMSKQGNKVVEFIRKNSGILIIVVLLILYNFDFVGIITSYILQPFIQLWSLLFTLF